MRRPDDVDFANARRIIVRHLRPTPLIAATADPRIWLKLETLQPTGAFKIRGALAALAAAGPERDILAVSAGNHALGIAHASAVLGVAATVVIAETASSRKRALLEALPIRVLVAGASYDEAEAYALDLARRDADRFTFVSGYNDPHVIAGQSTIVDELVAQLPADRGLTIVVPAGGGGLLGGIAMRSAQLATNVRPIRVIGVEAAQSRALSASVAHGAVVDVPIGDTIADGLAGNAEPGTVTVDIVRAYGVPFVAVPERALHDAVRALAFDHGVVAEGAGAAGFAAVREGSIDRDDTLIVPILTGRNIAPDLYLSILSG